MLTMIAKPASPETPKLRINKPNPIKISTGAAQIIWKYPHRKSMRVVSVDMRLVILPIVKFWTKSSNVLVAWTIVQRLLFHSAAYHTSLSTQNHAFLVDTGYQNSSAHQARDCGKLKILLHEHGWSDLHDVKYDTPHDSNANWRRICVTVTLLTELQNLLDDNWKYIDRLFHRLETQAIMSFIKLLAKMFTYEVMWFEVYRQVSDISLQTKTSYRMCDWGRKTSLGTFASADASNAPEKLPSDF